LESAIFKAMKTVHAVFEKGMFRPLEAVELPEHCEVEFEPRPIQQPHENGDSLSSIYAVLSERYKSGERDVAARHNEHQP
jgi:predicted DNA-binding antitoxin AbrB/MazE fold protein